MKKLILPVLPICLLLLNSCGNSTEKGTAETKDSLAVGEKDLPSNHDESKRYGIESGMVEYEYTGTQKGKETLYFDDWGWKEAKYTETEMNIMGISQKTSHISIIDEDMIYTYDHNTKKGTKMKNPLLGSLSDEQKKDWGEVGKEMMKQMGAVRTGEESVAGKDCEIWEIKSLGTKVWVWKNIVLKTNVKMAGMEFSNVAVKVQDGGSIDSDKFNFPAGIDRETFSDMSGVLDKVKKPNN